MHESGIRVVGTHMQEHTYYASLRVADNSVSKIVCLQGPLPGLCHYARLHIAGECLMRFDFSLLSRPGGNITEARREDVINGEADCIVSDEKGVWILL